MNKVTYLFGAGASAKCLPTVAKIPERLLSFYYFLDENKTGSQETVEFGGITIQQMEDDLISECRDLIEQVKKHQSVDTYAKKLRIRATRSGMEKIKYLKLKIILSSFFIYEQLVNPIDDRYDAFFASILGDSDIYFAQNLRILSWNYDFQFEKAYSLYSNEQTLANNQYKLNVFPSTADMHLYQDSFSIFKLNGTTGFYSKNRRTNLNINEYFDMADEPKLINGPVRLVILWVYCESRDNETTSVLCLGASLGRGN
jgi:hypothetical protein